MRSARIGGASRGNVPPQSGCENGKLQVEATPSLTTGAPSELGQLDQLGERVGLGDRVAGDQQRALGPRQPPRRLVDRRAVADQPRGHAGGAAEVEVALGVQHVDRQREEDGPGRMGERRLHGAPHDARQVLQAVRLRRPLHVGRAPPAADPTRGSARSP